MAYEQLTEKTVVSYLKNQPELSAVFSDFDGLTVREIGDGNLNFVYVVTNPAKPEETAVVKQAVPFLRCVGESWPLSRERMNFEIMALNAQAELCPKHVPKVYFASKDMSLVVMQNLKDHKILRGEIIQGKVFPHLAGHMSSFLANTLFFSSDLNLDHRTKKERVKDYINIDLCKITEDFVFTHPYEDNATNVYNPKLSREAIDLIQKDPKVRAAVGEMKYAFMNNAEALLHGDLHIGSVMANERETYVIDPEFAFYGPMGFDIGAFIGNLYLAYFSHDYRQRAMGKDPAPYRRWLLETAEAIWNGFAEKFEANWTGAVLSDAGAPWRFPDSAEAFAAYRAVFMRRIFADSVGFAACKMMRRIVGLAKVADIADIPDLAERARAEENVLRMASRMAVERGAFAGPRDLSELAMDVSPLAG